MSDDMNVTVITIQRVVENVQEALMLVMDLREEYSLGDEPHISLTHIPAPFGGSKYVLTVQDNPIKKEDAMTREINPVVYDDRNDSPVAYDLDQRGVVTTPEADAVVSDPVNAQEQPDADSDTLSATVATPSVDAGDTTAGEGDAGSGGSPSVGKP